MWLVCWSTPFRNYTGSAWQEMKNPCQYIYYYTATGIEPTTCRPKSIVDHYATEDARNALILLCGSAPGDCPGRSGGCSAAGQPSMFTLLQTHR